MGRASTLWAARHLLLVLLGAVAELATAADQDTVRVADSAQLAAALRTPEVDTVLVDGKRFCSAATIEGESVGSGVD